MQNGRPAPIRHCDAVAIGAEGRRDRGTPPPQSETGGSASTVRAVPSAFVISTCAPSGLKTADLTVAEGSCSAASNRPLVGSHSPTRPDPAL